MIKTLSELGLAVDVDAVHVEVDDDVGDVGEPLILVLLHSSFPNKVIGGLEKECLHFHVNIALQV